MWIELVNVGISDARERKAAALAAERQRLARVQREREQGRRDSIWQEFRVTSERIPGLRDVVEAVILEAGPSGGDAAEKLSALIDDKLCPEAPRALLELLGNLPPETGILHVARLHALRVPQVARFGQAAAMLAGEAEPHARVLRGLPYLSPALNLWRDVELLALGEKVRSLERFLEQAPLSLVDDLLDRNPAVPLSGEERDDQAENLYLRARRDPSSLSGQDLEELDWHEEVWRRRLQSDPHHEVPEDAPELARLLGGVATGDSQALEQLVGYLRGKPRLLVQQLLANRSYPVRWPKVLLADPALWPVLERLCLDIPIEAAKAPLGDFAAWRDLRAAHHGLMKVSAAAYRTVAPHLESEIAWVREEATAAEVYLDLRFADPGDSQSLRDALRRLSALDSDHPVIRDNIAWARRHLETDRNNRGPLFNPYLELGVPHGAPVEEWKEAWRILRKELRGRTEELSDVNQARDLLRDIEAGGGLDANPQYVLPVHRDRLFPSSCVPRQLVPDARPLERRTRPSAPEDTANIRREAVVSIMKLAASERTP
ncbi:hypothetical protein [Nocardiopsis deserti]|uniref:hypothetical protein n=1 Tax=Nocardiopsis deserti TaxID=2605988 RepID=UPI00123A97AC|nr:hypothetical protein [Nocardiopsis deserti]